MDWIASLPQPLWIIALLTWIGSRVGPLQFLRNVALVNGFVASVLSLGLLHSGPAPLLRFQSSGQNLETAAILLSSVWILVSLSIVIRDRYFVGRDFPKLLSLGVSAIAILGYVYLYKAGPQAMERMARTHFQTSPWGR
jgi:hypothetical protein